MMLLPGFEPTIKEVMADMERGAVFSEDRKYRTRLFRLWDPRRKGILFIMLNPSTADETKDDRTVRRCIGFANKWGFGWLEVRNIFSLCSTDPGELYMKARDLDEDPVGPDNRLTYEDDCFEKIVLAWGEHGRINKLGKAVMRELFGNGLPLYSFGLTRSGEPKHPLYIPVKTDIQRIESLDSWI